jgi:tRNA-dihydrouridine synthase
MIGRGAMRDPWIFRDTHALLTAGRVPPPPSVAERIALMNRHFEHLVRIRGERHACITFRQRVTWYAGKLGPCREFQDRMRHISAAEEYWELIEAFFPSGSGAEAVVPQPASC